MAYRTDRHKGPFPNKAGEFCGNSASWGDFDQRQADAPGVFRVGRPQPFDERSVEQLEAVGWVGAYLAADRPLLYFEHPLDGEFEELKEPPGPPPTRPPTAAEAFPKTSFLARGLRRPLDDLITAISTKTPSFTIDSIRGRMFESLEPAMQAAHSEVLDYEEQPPIEFKASGFRIISPEFSCKLDELLQEAGVEIEESKKEDS